MSTKSSGRLDNLEFGQQGSGRRANGCASRCAMRSFSSRRHHISALVQQFRAAALILVGLQPANGLPSALDLVAHLMLLCIEIPGGASQQQQHACHQQPQRPSGDVRIGASSVFT